MSSSINLQNNMDLNQGFLAPLVEIWWPLLERVMSYCAEKIKIGVNFDFKVKIDLEDQGQPPPQKKTKKKQKTIRTLTKVF